MKSMIENNSIVCSILLFKQILFIKKGNANSNSSKKNHSPYFSEQLYFQDESGTEINQRFISYKNGSVLNYL